MNKNIVSFDLAKHLKEKGFNEPCHYLYTQRGEVHYDDYPKRFNETPDYAAPFLQDAEQWMKDNTECVYCNSYQDGWCTNFGKEVNSDDSCEHYQCDIVEYTCQQCGRKYQYSDSDAICRDKFCCKACEYGY